MSKHAVAHACNGSFTSTLVGDDWGNPDTAERFIAGLNSDGLADSTTLDLIWLYCSKNTSARFLGVT